MNAARMPSYNGNHVGAVPNFKPFRDRRVSVITVVCPTCEAAVGEVCRTANGIPAMHESRRRMALRKERES